MSFIASQNILYSGQYGFRNNLSTSLAIMDLVEELTSAIDSSKFTVGVFIDLKKAFDTINHDILIKKLEIYGVRGIASDWIRCYLSNRKQYVLYNDTSSDLCDIVCGVPQGSILGPALFLLFINDLCNVSNTANFILFADDTNIFQTGSSINELCKSVSEELAKLDTWFKVNRLSLNVNKTNFMIFTNNAINCDPKVNINGSEIERVFNTKFLGVIIDSKLTWIHHIKHIKGKVAKNLSVMHKVKHLLHQKALHTLYC